MATKTMDKVISYDIYKNLSDEDKLKYKRQPFDEDFDIWFGDTDYENRIKLKAEENKKIAIIKEGKAFVYHFGGKSQKYKSKQTLDRIAKDREYYYIKYPNERPRQQKSK